MGTYYHPNATDPLEAKKQFLREHGYKIPHCFRNFKGPGFVLCDTKAEVNAWYKEQTGKYFYKEEYEPGTTFTEADAMGEIEKMYGAQIDRVLKCRDYSRPILAIGLPSPSAFGNKLILFFASSNDIYRYNYLRLIGVNSSMNNLIIRAKVIDLIYSTFYDSYFKKRIEGSKQYHSQNHSTSVTPQNVYEPSNNQQQTPKQMSRSETDFRSSGETSSGLDLLEDERKGCIWAVVFAIIGALSAGTGTQSVPGAVFGLVVGAIFGYVISFRG